MAPNLNPNSADPNLADSETPEYVLSHDDHVVYRRRLNEASGLLLEG
jgi:hypothetical protein